MAGERSVGFKKDYQIHLLKYEHMMGGLVKKNNTIPPHDILSDYLSTVHYSNRSYINKDLKKVNI